MALAFDAVSLSNSNWTTTVSSVSWSHTFGATGNRIILIAIYTYSSALRTVSSVDVGGTAATRVDSITATLESANQCLELWYLDGSSSGSKTITVTLSGTTDFVKAQAVSYSGKTASGIAASAKTQNTSASTSSPTNNVNVPYSDCWLVGAGYSRSPNAPTAGAGTTARSAVGQGQIVGDSNGVVGTGNQTLAYSTTDSNKWPGVITAAISEANAGGAASVARSLAGRQAVNRASRY
jgi:hypothetical protein